MVVIYVHSNASKFILVHWRLTWIKRMEWLVDPPGKTRTELDKTERVLAMSGHFRGVKDPLEMQVEHETQENYVTVENFTSCHLSSNLDLNGLNILQRQF